MDEAVPARGGRLLRHRLQALGPLLVALCVLAVLWAVVLVSSRIQQERMEESNRARLRLINNAAVQQTRALIHGVDGKLQVVDHWLQSHPNIDPARDAAFADLIALLDEPNHRLFSVTLASADGKALDAPPQHAWLKATPGVTWGGPGRLHIGTPVRSAPGEPWRWPISRQFGRPVGQIAGAVAWIDVSTLSALQEGLRDSAAGAITLTRSDGVAIMRTPHIERLMGLDFRKRGPAVLQPASAPQGMFAYDGSQTDGTDRIVSYERLGDYPVTVLVSQGVNEALATFHARRQVLYMGLLAMTIFAIIYSVLLARSQRAARQGRAEFAALSDAFPLGIFRTDLHGETTYANDAYFHKTGLAPERLAWGWSEIVQPDGRGKLLDTWRKAVRDGRPLSNTLQVRHPGTGAEKMLSIRTAPLHVDGRLVGVVGSLEDVTERMQEQRAQRMLTAIFEQSTDVVAQLAPDGRLLYLNPAGRARLMLSHTDALDTLRFEHLTPAHRMSQVRDVIIPGALDSGVWVGETSVLGGDGHETPVSEMLIVHRDDQNRIEAFSVVMRDITYDLQARVELQRSDSILNVVASTLPAMVAVVDREQRYLFTNDAFDRWVGPRKDGLVGKTVDEVLGEHQYALRQLHIEAALAGHRTMFETEVGGRGGSRFYETTYVPFLNAEGEVAGFVSLSQDITAHRLEQLKLLDASQTDALTGMLNRAGFDQRIQLAVDQARQHQQALALLCIDLDGFKTVNDQHGHAAGDALLTAVAGRLKRVLRPSDVLGRLGGDEFAVALPDVQQPDDAVAVARKIVDTLCAPFKIDHKTVHIGASVGVAIAVNGHDSVATLMQRADAALYRAKRAGRGRYELARDDDPIPTAAAG